MLPSAVRGAFEARDLVQPAERAALLAVVAELERGCETTTPDPTAES